MEKNASNGTNIANICAILDITDAITRENTALVYAVANSKTNLNFTQAASLPLAIQTAYEELETEVFNPGKSILVSIGAGVGILVIQLARKILLQQP